MSKQKIHIIYCSVKENNMIGGTQEQLSDILDFLFVLVKAFLFGKWNDMTDICSLFITDKY